MRLMVNFSKPHRLESGSGFRLRSLPDFHPVAVGWNIEGKQTVY